MKRDIPIVLVAFGTTTEALKTYAFMDSVFRDRFESIEIFWAYSSRMVRDWIKKRKGIDLRHPHEVLNDLVSGGYEWAVVQSLHLLCGHEFYRMVEEVRQVPLRTSIGLPLLSTPQDYKEVARALKPLIVEEIDTANLLVGHGTDHPSWASYLALESTFQKMGVKNIFVGALEGAPSMKEVVMRVCSAGFTKVHLIPFMLVAGTHFFEDLAGADNSLKKAFESWGLKVSVVDRGIGYQIEVVEIFCRHIEEALEAIG